jgi:hypothetical protein
VKHAGSSPGPPAYFVFRNSFFGAKTAPQWRRKRGKPAVTMTIDAPSMTIDAPPKTFGEPSMVMDMPPVSQAYGH